MKKLTALLIATLMALTMVACSAPAPAPAPSPSTPAPAPAPAIKYPTKPIQIVIPAGPGGDTDTNSRMLGKYLEKELGQPVVIQNVGGAGGSTGTRQVMDSPADGYKMLFFHPGLLLNDLIGLTDYNHQDLDLAGMAVLDQTNVWVTSAKAPFNDMKELAEQAKTKEFKFATEVGSFTHLQVMAVQEAAKIKFNVVDAGDAASKIAALLGQQIDVISSQYGLVKQYVESGDFKVLGVMSAETNPLMPDVKTFKEQGIDAAFDKFFYLAYPKGTDPEIINIMTKAMENVSKNPEYIKEAAEKMMVTPYYLNPADCLKYLDEQYAIYSKFVEKK